MADILRVSTPVVEKNQPIQPKAGIDPTSEFQLQQPQRVIQPQSRGEMPGQSLAKLPGSDTPNILLNMLKDPDVTVSFLKNISMLEEIYKLLPANNNTVTPEIEQMFHQLLIHPDELAQEMQRQENSATMFKGPFFDFLREISGSSAQQGETQRAVANLMRSINNLLCHDDILDAVANSLAYLSKNLHSSKTLTSRIDLLVAAYRNGTMPFDTLKSETLVLLRDIENSILYSPNLAKTVSITTYNLSRYNDSLSFFQEATVRLRQLLGGPARQTLSKFASDFLAWIRAGKPADGAEQAGIKLAAFLPQGTQSSVQQAAPNGQQGTQNNAQQTVPNGQPSGQNNAPQTAQSAANGQPSAQNMPDGPPGTQEVPQQAAQNGQPSAQGAAQAAGQQTVDPDAQRQQEQRENRQLPPEMLEETGSAGASREEPLPSKVMDALVSMISKEAQKNDLSTSEEKRIDNILSSLLSSPCNFTPLLHFVVPAYYDQVRAFAEIWINPESDAKDMPAGVDHGIHLLMVVDADAVGRFEAEVFAHDKIVDINLYCPPEYQSQMQGYLSEIKGALKGYAYRTGQVRLAPLVKARSLMDVFKSLPYKRVGVDVKI